MATDDRIRCEHCGFVSEKFADQLALKSQAADIALEAASKKQAQINRLKADRDNKATLDPYYADAYEVWEYWRRLVSPQSREFTGERLDHVLARLHAGYDVAALKTAIRGAKANLDQTGKRQWADLGSICLNEKNLTMNIEFAGERKRTQAPILQVNLGSYRRALTSSIIERLEELKGWSESAMSTLGLGYDPRARRVVFPVHDAEARLVGVGRYAPNPELRNGSKMLAEGARELFPAPESLQVESIWLVEGEPDAVSMHSIGQPAVGIPGAGTWKEGWSSRFASFDRVRILMDCDDEGRRAAEKLAGELADHTDVQLVDLDPNRDDRYDVGDLVKEMGMDAVTHLAKLSTSLSSSTIHQMDRRRDEFKPAPFKLIYEALERADCRPKEIGEGRLSACCPVHDDRVPSMSVSEGDDGRVLLTCHAGCEPDDVVAALGLEWKDLFAA